MIYAYFNFKGSIISRNTSHPPKKKKKKKKKKSVIIYSPSCCSIPVRLSFFFGTQKKIFSTMFLAEQFGLLYTDVHFMGKKITQIHSSKYLLLFYRRKSHMHVWIDMRVSK